MKSIPPPVLLADDDSNDVFFMKRAFKMAQVENPLAIVSNGEEVVGYLTGKPPYHDRTIHPEPCLLVLDLKMPFMDGFDVLAWLKHNELRSKLPVIVLSCSNCPSDMTRAIELGALEYLVKPATLDDLVNLVCNIKSNRLLNPEVA